MSNTDQTLTADAKAWPLTYGQAHDLAVTTGCVVRSQWSDCVYIYNADIAGIEGVHDHEFPCHDEVINAWRGVPDHE